MSASDEKLKEILSGIYEKLKNLDSSALDGRYLNERYLHHSFKCLCGGLMMLWLAWCPANEVAMDAFNMQVESVTDTILEETDLSFDSVIQYDGDVLDEVPVQPLNDNVDKSGISVSQNVLQPKSDKLTQSNQKDKKIKNKQERLQKKEEKKQKKLIEKTKKEEFIQQRKAITDKKKTDKKVISEQDMKQYQSYPSYISLEVDQNEEIEEIKYEDINQEKSENTESSGHKLIHFLVGIGILWIIWKVMLRIWKIILRGWHRRCKKCGKWWALQIVDSELIDSWEEDELVKLNDRNAKGEITGTREAFQRVRKKQYKVHRKCKHCGQEYTSRETITIGG